ncbi:MAG: hypothetical protein ACJA01_003079 [Saprospiraceae bacterium]|jgi:hypothetical protein
MFLHTYIKDDKPFIKNAYLAILHGKGLIIDGFSGGLVLGNSHLNGGIHLIGERLPGEYQILAEIEGWEYLMNYESTSKYLEEIEELNSYINKDFKEYAVPENYKIIDARMAKGGSPAYAPVIITGKYSNFVINRHATKKHLSTLNEWNKETQNELLSPDKS